MITYTFNWIKIKMQAFFKVHYQNCINETGQLLALSKLVMCLTQPIKNYYRWLFQFN